MLKVAGETLLADFQVDTASLRDFRHQDYILDRSVALSCNLPHAPRQFVIVI